MEIGGDFDEDLFGETKNRDTKTKLVSYNAKFCEPHVSMLFVFKV